MIAVHDITEELKDLCLIVVPEEKICRAERNGSEVLILLKEKDEDYDYKLISWTVRKEINDVVYSDYSVFKKEEIDLEKGLFEQFQLFC